jgi:hypothetical protein
MEEFACQARGHPGASGRIEKVQLAMLPFLCAVSLTDREVSKGYVQFDPFNGASGVEVAIMWSELHGTVLHGACHCSQAWYSLDRRFARVNYCRTSSYGVR